MLIVLSVPAQAAMYEAQPALPGCSCITLRRNCVSVNRTCVVWLLCAAHQTSTAATTQMGNGHAAQSVLNSLAFVAVTPNLGQMQQRMKIITPKFVYAIRTNAFNLAATG